MERRAATSQEILDAAWSMARERGLAGLSLRDLAAAIGMRAPSLYAYFDSKNAIYDAMYRQGAQQFLDGHSAIRPTGDTLADLKAEARFFVGFCTDDTSRYQLLFQRTVPGFEPSPESFAISVACLDAVRRRFAASGFGERALDLWTAIGTGITDQQISNDPGGKRWTRLVDEAAEMFFAHQSTKPVKRKSRR